METTVTQEQPTSIHYHRHGSNTVYIIAVAIAITVLAVAGASLIVFFLCRRFNNKCTGTKENSALEEGDSTSKNKKNKNSFNSHDGSGNPISSAGDKQEKKTIFLAIIKSNLCLNARFETNEEQEDKKCSGVDIQRIGNRHRGIYWEECDWVWKIWCCLQRESRGKSCCDQDVE